MHEAQNAIMRWISSQITHLLIPSWPELSHLIFSQSLLKNALWMFKFLTPQELFPKVSSSLTKSSEMKMCPKAHLVLQNKMNFNSDVYLDWQPADKLWITYDKIWVSLFIHLTAQPIQKNKKYRTFLNRDNKKGKCSLVGKASSWNVPPKRCNRAYVSSIPCCGIEVREKILSTPSVGVRGKTHVRRYKCADWASSKKSRNNRKWGILFSFVFTLTWLKLR